MDQPYCMHHRTQDCLFQRSYLCMKRTYIPTQAHLMYNILRTRNVCSTAPGASGRYEVHVDKHILYITSIVASEMLLQDSTYSKSTGCKGANAQPLVRAAWLWSVLSKRGVSTNWVRWSLCRNYQCGVALQSWFRERGVHFSRGLHLSAPLSPEHVHECSIPTNSSTNEASSM